jgi:Ca-activated chloride channel family protein
MSAPKIVRLSGLASLALAALPAVACAWPMPAPNAPAPVVHVGPNDLDISFDDDVNEPLMIAGSEQTAYIKITLGGFALPSNQRSPINLALVLDRSGSMAGDKLEKAKEAALMVLDRLQPDDIISVVTYDSEVEVLVPATKANERELIRERISALTPRGSTALFAGVTFGLEEVSKNLDAKHVNRIVLLSDGQANVGPSSPNELGQLGEAAGRQGISITTIGLGLGYNEDLMTQLAMRSDGNHAFAENAGDLASIFSHELGDILSVVARDVDVEISFDDGITPVRALGRDATITGHKARVSLSQLYAKQQKHVLFEVKVPPGTAGNKRSLAQVAVSYANLISNKKGSKHGAVGVEFTKAPTQVAARENKVVMEAAIEAIATDENRRAVALRDAGKLEAAEKALKANSDYLAQQATRYKSERLQNYSKDNAADADNLAPAKWEKTRKTMRAKQSKNATQQAW